MKSFLIGRNKPVKQAMRQMKQIGEKQLFVIDDKAKLFGSISDGDIRKWILAEGTLAEAVSRVCNKNPITVSRAYDIETVKKLMLDLKIEAIPVVNERKKVIEVLVWDNVFRGGISKRKKEELRIPVVIMAGGKGTRLDPFTKILPKPLIPIGDKPVIEIIMSKFTDYGIKDFYLTVNHKSRMIKSYFEEMTDKYNIKYIEEEIPLGTAGGLRLLKNKIKGILFVTNCDTIIEGNYAEMVNFFNEKYYDMVLIVSYKNHVIPYGVCEVTNNGELKSIKEKPEQDLLANTGMYILKTKLLDLIPENRIFNATDLIVRAQKHGYKVGVFPINEDAWIDIGQWEEYRKAVEKMKIIR